MTIGSSIRQPLFLITQSGFDILRIHRQTGTDLVVDFRNGSVLTASDLTNAELQAIHIAEEGRDQTVDLAKEYSDAAGTSAGNAKDSEDEARRIAESIKTAGLRGMLPVAPSRKASTLLRGTRHCCGKRMVTITAGMVHFQRTFLLAQLLRLLVVLVKWVSIGDAALRGQISDPEGATNTPHYKWLAGVIMATRVDGGGW
ncbi:tail fiber protein [Enterobacter phage 02_vB_Eclo_IJM]|nr:tail fiber protein [Enterobacter phage 02_vB_Eclo_IJM]